MANNGSSHSKILEPSGIDDLKLIHGVGPGIEKRLHRAGILTFEQLAALSPEEIAPLVLDIIGITVDRIASQDWIGQARKLATSPAEASAPNEVVTSDDGQHYASFTMQLLLDGANEVRRTRLIHVQTGRTDTWPGWDGTRLLDFVIGQSELRIPAAAPSGHDDLDLIEPPPDSGSSGEPIATSEPPARLAGELQVRELSVWPSGADRPRSLLRHDQPFSVRLALDLSNVVAPPNAPLDCAVTIHAKSLSGRGRQVVGQAHRAVIAPAEEMVLVVDGSGLGEDTYRLEAKATVDLAAPGAPASTGPACLYHGPIVAVY